MKRRSSEKKENQNLKIALFFFLGVFFLILLSISIKVITIARASIFDGIHQFTIAVQKDTHITFLSFAPQANTIALLSVSGGKSIVDVERQVALPVDGFLISSDFNQNDSLQHMLFSFVLHYRTTKTNLTVIDILRLLSFARGIGQSAITRQSISAQDDIKTTENAISSRFADQTISQENISLEILNGTDIAGLGNRLARLVTHMGGNVVFVSTTEKEKEQTRITFSGGKIPYTIERLQKVLHTSVSLHGKKELGDAIIVIGKDSLHQTSGVFY